MTATDSSTGAGPYTGSMAYTLTVNAATITVAPASLPAATVGAAYSQTITASGGTSTYSFAVTSGSLPAGLSLATNGALTGTATAGGSFTFTVTATDSSTGTGPYTGSRTYTLTVNAATITVAPATLPAATVGAAYSQTITASGGTSTYSFAVTSGSLPAGLSLTTNGALTGTATAGGSFTFTVTATDSSTGTGPYTGSRAYTLTVNAPTITVSPTTLPAATVGVVYSQAITAGGGTSPYTFTISAGALPAGLTLASDGTLSGTATAGGSFTFTVKAVDSTTGTGPYNGTRAYTLTVGAATITIAPATLPSATVAAAYSQSVTASGGTAPYTYTKTAGTLPAGLTLATTGVVSGTPTAGGTFTFTVKAVDSSTGTGPYNGSQVITLTVNAPTITVAPSTLPAATVAALYSQTITASGGTSTYTFAKTAGSLPAGLTLASNGTLSGTPTAGGSFTFTVTATDSSTGTGPYTGSLSYTLTVTAATVTVAPASLPAATVGAAYSQTITASGGTSPYSFAVTSGSLPAGLSLASGGVLSGTPTAGGTFSFTVTATDSSTGAGPYTGSMAYTLTVNAATITVAPASLPAATVGAAYSQTIKASGGTSTYSFAVTSGSLPAGLSLATNGALTGTATAGGSFTFTVTATDSSTGTGPYTGSRTYTLTVNAATITVAPATLPAATVGASYSQTITASGGTSTYSFAVTSGSLPAGLSLATNGALTGTATAGGSFTFTVTATDSSTGTGPYTGSKAYTLTVSAPTITVSPTTLPAATVGVVYSQAITAGGGTSPYTFTISAGALPAGLTLASDGTLSGTATAGGSFTFTVKAIDSSTGTGPYNGTRAYTLTVNAATVVVGPASLPAATVGAAYSQTIVATGGTSPYTYTKTSGSLPAGVTLASTGVVSGTPTAGGTFTFTVKAVDSSTGSGPYNGSKTYTLTVNSATIVVAPSTLPAATVAAAYSQTITASGGTSTYTFAKTAGSLPAGLTLASNGTLSGTPTAGGSFTFTVTATDSSTGTGPYTGSLSYTLTVNAATVTVAPASLPAATVGAVYSQTITASGATSPYTFAKTAGSLPAGLSLATNGALTGTPTAGGTFSFTVTATDSSTGAGPYTGSMAYTLTVNAATITVAPATLPAATVGAAYSQTITASGGTSTYTFAVTSGSLPAGLSLATNGALTGTATAGGSFTFTVTATDSSTGTGPYTGSRTYTLTVNAATITVAPATLPAATVGASYSQTITASGGTSTYSFAVTSGSLPAGLSLATNGALTGTATAGGSFTFTVTATDSSTGTGPYTGSRAYTLTVNAPTITLAPSALSSATVGVPYSQAITASGGTSTYTYTKTAGTLPAGLTLATTGVVSGTATAGGSFSFTVKAVDSSTGTGPYNGSQVITLTVNAPTITITPSSLPSATAGVAYSQTLTTSGGTAGYTYSVTAGALPTGMLLGSSTGTITGSCTVAATYNFTIRATDSSTGTGPYTGSKSYSITVNSNTATQFSVGGFSSPQVAGTPFTVTVTALDQYGNTATSYTASTPYVITLGTADSGAVLGTVGSWINGVATFTPMLTLAMASQTLTVTDNSGITGTSTAFEVDGGDATQFRVTVSSPSPPEVVGVAFTVTVTAIDNYGNTDTNYSKSNPYTITTSVADVSEKMGVKMTGGVGTFSMTLSVITPSQTITVSDHKLGTVGTSDPFAVIGATSAPTANSQSVTVPHNTANAITLTGTDPNTPPLALTYAVTGAGPAHGTLSGTAPSLTYTPNTGYNGADSFTFTVNNGTYTSTAATVSITVSVGTPIANSQSVNVPHNTATAITLTGSDDDNPTVTLTYAVATQPTNGTLSGTAPNLTYTPNAGYNGSDSFTFTVGNGTNTSAAGTVSITVMGGTPVANAQSVTVPFNTATGITLTGTDSNTPPLPLTYAVTGSGPTNGALSGTAPSLTYTPNAGYHGSDSFTFTVNNGTATSTAATVSITVGLGTPTANSQSVSVPNNTATPITLTGSDPDSPALAITYAVATQPTYGTLSGTAPSLTYTPNAGYNGPDSFTFTVNNGTNTSSAATVSITVGLGVPTANNQSITVPHNTATIVTRTGTDPNTPPLPLTYTVDTQPTNGTLSGTVPNQTYTPNTGYHGPDSFTFKATNGTTTSSDATVSITVGIGTPTANSQSVNVAHNTATAITLTGSDDDIPAVTLTYNIVAQPTNGTLSGTAPNVTYTPNAGYSGPDSFTFNIGNGTNTSTAGTVSITVAGGIPVANNQTVTVPHDTASGITLTGTDSNTPPLTLTYAITGSGPLHGTLTGTVPNVTYTPNTGYNGADSFTFNVSNGVNTSTDATVSIAVNVGTPVANPQAVSVPHNTATSIVLTASDDDTPTLTLTYTVATQPTNGTLSGTAPNLTYTPNAGFHGSDSFTFTANNGTYTSVAATVSITVAVGTPTANAQSVTVQTNTATSITLTGSDDDSPTLPLTYTVVTQPTHGALTGTAPNVTYTPTGGYTGPDSFTFTVSNGTNTSAAGTVTITVNGSTPIANSQSVTVPNNTATSITLTGTDPNTPPLPLTYVVTGTGPTNGTFTGTAPSLTYTPNAGFHGSDSFTFTVNNGVATSTAATVTITVGIGTPVAGSLSVTVQHLTATSVTLTGSDPDSPALALSYTVASQPTNGTLSGTAPSLTYTPTGGYHGPDSFTSTVSNGTNTSAAATVSITVDVGAPGANAQAIAVAPNTVTAITLAGTDPNTPTLPLTFNITGSGPAHGALRGVAPNVTYTPRAGYHGNDAFTFTVNNGTSTSSTATVTITVDAGIPVANNQSVVAPPGTATPIHLTGADPDSPPLALTYTVTGGPANGTLGGIAPALTYTPNAGYSGNDSFTFTASNGVNTSAPATVSIKVGVGIPVANSQSVAVPTSTPAVIVLTGTDPDTPPLPLTYTVTGGPANGTLTGSGTNLTYTPNAGYQGSDSFTFTVSNGTNTSAPATVTITVGTFNSTTQSVYAIPIQDVVRLHGAIGSTPNGAVFAGTLEGDVNATFETGSWYSQALYVVGQRIAVSVSINGGTATSWTFTVTSSGIGPSLFPQ